MIIYPNAQRGYCVNCATPLDYPVGVPLCADCQLGDDL